MYRKDPLITGEIYHILNKSIAGFKIFNNDSEFSRTLAIIKYYQVKNQPVKFSRFIKLNEVQKKAFGKGFCDSLSNTEKLIEIIGYCIMPTHVHLLLKQLQDKGISVFMKKVLSSHTHYFNMLHKRKGPLWEGRFKNILVETDEQLIHLSRYIHLNPVTAYLTKNPEDWPASSYKEYLSQSKEDGICKYDDVLEIESASYKKFVEDRASYQKELKKIKDLILE